MFAPTGILMTRYWWLSMVATAFLRWRPVAAAPSGAARVQLPQHAMLRVFGRRLRLYVPVTHQLLQRCSKCGLRGRHESHFDKVLLCDEEITTETNSMCGSA